MNLDLRFKSGLLLLALVACSLNVFAQDINIASLTIELQEKIETAPDQTHSVYLLLADQVDVRALENELIRQNASMHERAYQVVTQLQAKANATQPAFLQDLKTIEGIDQESIKTLWITNAVAFDADVNAIATLSRHPAVEIIAYDWEIEFFDLEQKNATLSPNLLQSTETGLEVIGAPELWAMGYTGYGQTILVADTGTDPSHPALANNFSYHNNPLDEAWASPSAEPQLCENDHGTHVAGTAVGIDRVLEDTIGVAYEAEWIGGPIPLNDCNFTSSIWNSLTIFQWALNPDGNVNTTDDIPEVINNSWGRSNPSFFDCGDPGTVNANNALMAAGVATVYAAGNDGPGAQTVGSPAMNNYDLVRFFAVGNVNANVASLPIASGSSRGPTVCSGTGSLKIKPEVSAPGTNVRSSVFNGNYTEYSGTSMAAPHVAGAIMILKEAFPELSGEDIMLALYFSAIDLGDEGEDNDYGMGIINLPAAYQYLVDEGNTPTPPVSATNDVVLLRAELEDFACLEGVSPFISVENNGTETIESIQVSSYFDGVQNYTESYDWEVTIEPGERAELQMPAMSINPGDYELTVDLALANGAPDNRDLNNRLKMDVTVLDVFEAPISLVATTTPCADGQVVLQSDYDGEATVTWYDSPTSNVSIGAGNLLTVDLGAVTETVYAEVSPIEQVGKVDNSEGTVQFDDDDRGLKFDTDVPITIKTVKVYAQEGGGRIIRLDRANGGGQSKIVSLEAGENIVELDFSVPVGEDHEIYLQGGGALAFTLGGNAFPYTIPNVISITGPINGSGLFYNYFFDWQIEYDYWCGRTAVEVDVQDVDTPLEVAITPTNTEQDVAGGNYEIGFNGAANNAASWSWDFGDGTTSTDQNTSHVYADTGSYQVILTVISNEGCSNSTMVEITLFDSGIVSTNDVILENRLSIFPNPTKEVVSLQFDWPTSSRLEYYLVDMFGRKVSERYTARGGNDVQTLSLANLASGAYILVVESDEGRATRRIVKSN
jgi:subtilisin family serine protease